jgi:hypothetical protein
VSAPAPSPELIARAIKLRREGLSYTAIGEACGVTKGAVAGMLFRAGVCVSCLTRVPARDLKRKRKADAPKPPKPEPVRLPPPPLRAVSIAFAEGQDGCQWPSGERPYVWCGAPRLPSRSYCSKHDALAYRMLA